MAVLTGKISGITIYDFDNKDEYNKLVEEHPELKKCYTVSTKKGYHIYFNYNESIGQTSDASNVIKGLDIRNDGGCAICPPTKYKLLNGDIARYEEQMGKFIDVPDYLIKILKQSSIEKSKVKKTKVQKPKVKVVNDDDDDFDVEVDVPCDDIDDIDENDKKKFKSGQELFDEEPDEPDDDIYGEKKMARNR